MFQFLPLLQFYLLLLCYTWENPEWCSKTNQSVKITLSGLPTQNSRIFPGSYEENLDFSRNSRPWRANPQIQGISGLEGQIPKFKESQALKEKSPNSRNPRPWKKNPQIQGIPGLERKIPKFKESQALKGKSQNSRNSRFPGSVRTNLGYLYQIFCYFYILHLFEELIKKFQFLRNYNFEMFWDIQKIIGYI